MKPAFAAPDIVGSTGATAGGNLPSAAVAVAGLTKTYRGSGKRPATTALHGVDLEIRRGEIFGLLGPNGAGKSTFINILAGLVMKTGGRASIWGHDIDVRPRQARACIGVVPQELNVDPFFTPRETLDLQAGLYGVAPRNRRTDDILAAVGLTEQAEAYARSLSGGMRRRLLVGKALVHTPPVLVLDEPTAGVDVELRQQLWDYVRGLNARGTTIVLTTHYLQEAEELCDRIGIIDRGRLVACDTTSALKRRLDRKSIVIVTAEAADDVPPALTRFDARRLDPWRLRLEYRPSRTPAAEVLAAVAESGLTLQDLTTEDVDLEDIFLELTSRRGEDGSGK